MASALIQNPDGSYMLDLNRVATWPLRNQHETWTEDGQPSEAANYDCGETCVAALAEWLMGARLPIDTIHDGMLSQGIVGPTSEAQMRNYLESHWGIQTSSYYPTSRPEAMKYIRGALWDDRPAIYLRCFQYIGDPAFHWCVATGCAGISATTTQTVWSFNPWTGAIETLSNDDFWAWMAPYPTNDRGLIIVPNRKRSIVPAAPIY